ncbi:hypothetical protein GobsT_46860 [Gemmata obscuriglobus]|uniref:Uncharacterized protein n=1 Tax=Gemmata obscuriglobus TaxID=114 RepID=A0A2Z3GXH3_9BACT|nr:hypothetical protein C1280_10215 [Gemmata obscuriglobus]QEG29887.1 hypothetical protein GobsT_46860 [Gemmata obscuriglobus]VTS09205.1 unnamed protein product [Gemmata obscuriglobus UQM 2246]
MMAVQVSLLFGNQRGARRMSKHLLTRDCGLLVGRTVGEVLVALGLEPNECQVFDEPPAVGRGLRWNGLGGPSVQVWVTRQAGIFRSSRNWATTEFLSFRAVGIIVVQNQAPCPGAASGQPPNVVPPQFREWWAGGSRFSPDSQREAAEPGAAPDTAG